MPSPSILVPAAAALLALTVPGTPSAAATGSDVGYFWTWSDGSTARSRTLSESRFGSQSRLPDLVVATDPARPGRRVVLQFHDARGWHRDDLGYTDGDGVVRLEVNPYCADGAWCRRAFEYRLVAGRSTASLTLRFTP